MNLKLKSCLLLIILLMTFLVLSVTAVNVHEIKKEDKNFIESENNYKTFFNYYVELKNYNIGFNVSSVIIFNVINEKISSIVEISYPGSNKVVPHGHLNFQLDNIDKFDEIWFNNLYDGIDLKFYFKNQELKYDFIVNPNADPSKISISINNGLINLAEKSVLIEIKSSFGNILLKDENLYLYQEKNTEIEAKFIRKNKNTYGFKIEPYDKGKILIIDPIINLNSPSNGSIIQSLTTINVSINGCGNCSKNFYHWDSSELIETFSTELILNIPQSDGQHVLNIIALDLFDLSSDTKRYVFTVDDTGPVISLTSHENNSFLRLGEELTVHFEDNNTVIQIFFAWNNTFNETDPGGYSENIEVDIVIPNPGIDGNHTLFLSTYDNLTNWNNKSFVFIYDSISPVVVLNSPNNDTFVKSNTLVNMTISDSYIEIVRYKWDTLQVEVFNSPYDTQIPFGTVIHVLYVHAKDLASNWMNVTYVFHADNSEPSIILDSPINNSILPSNISINFTISDNINLSAVFMGWDIPLIVSNVSLPIGGPFIITIPLSDGQHILYVNARDTVGNENNKTFVFTIDSISPEIILLSPSNNTIQKSSIKILLEINDSYESNVSYKWDNASFRPYNYIFIDFISGDGPHFLTVLAFDIVGNINTTTYFFIIDDTPPVISLISPINNEVIAPNTLITLSITGSNGSFIYNWGLGPNITAIVSSSPIVQSWEGQQSLFIYSSDTTGNWRREIFFFFIDKTGPEIILNEEKSKVFYNEFEIIQFIITDDRVNISNVEFTWDDGQFSTLLDPYRVTLPLRDGLHNLTVVATDSLNNTAAKQFHFIIDATKPEITLLYPKTTDLLTGSIIRIIISDDFGLNYDSLTFKWNNNPNVYELGFSASSWEISASNKPGNYELFIIAEDLAGNKAEKIFIFHVFQDYTVEIVVFLLGIIFILAILILRRRIRWKLIMPTKIIHKIGISWIKNGNPKPSEEFIKVNWIKDKK